MITFMPRYKLTVAYEGTEFHGWQKQEPPDAPPLRTVQMVLEDAVRKVVREPVLVGGASRTDAGVHAVGQVAAFTTQQKVPTARLPNAINARLPDDVQVVKAEIVNDAFDPISDALSKGYRYRIAHSRRGSVHAPLFDRRMLARTHHTLDVARMNAAAKHLIGTHDFASFTKKDHGKESTVRTIFDCSVTATNARRLRIDISGDGFLYNMVRVIAGTLLEAGRNRIDPDDMKHIIAARDRAAAGDTLPPEGLCLMWITYDAS
jgi:tRNA pseudouridine38-40 synthase